MTGRTYRYCDGDMQMRSVHDSDLHREGVQLLILLDTSVYTNVLPYAVKLLCLALSSVVCQ